MAIQWGVWCLLSKNHILVLDQEHWFDDLVDLLDNWEEEEVFEENLEDGLVDEVAVVQHTQMLPDQQQSNKEDTEDSGSDFAAKIKRMFTYSYNGAEIFYLPKREQTRVTSARRSK